MPISSSPWQLVGYIEGRLCGLCVVVDADALPPAPLPPSYRDRLRCTRCGRRGAHVRIGWSIPAAAGAFPP